VGRRGAWLQFAIVVLRVVRVVCLEVGEMRVHRRVAAVAREGVRTAVEATLGKRARGFCFEGGYTFGLDGCRLEIMVDCSSSPSKHLTIVIRCGTAAITNLGRCSSATSCLSRNRTPLRYIQHAKHHPMQSINPSRDDNLITNLSSCEEHPRCSSQPLEALNCTPPATCTLNPLSK
jgi:hypothetical protein